MKVSVILSIAIFLGGIFMLALPIDSEAARMGGGRSFGGRPSMSTPAPAPAMRQQTPTQQQQPMAAAQGAQAARPGMFGGMGGLFGGLLAGTLIGSLLSGSGFGGGGGFMDILMIGLLLFVGWKLFTRLRANREATPATAGGPSGARPNFSDNRDDNTRPMQREAAGWDSLRGNGGGAAEAPVATVNVPAGFDVEEFLQGAKAAYTRLQKAWDKRDLNDISQFATPAVLQGVREQLEAEPTPTTTEVMLVNAQLLDVETQHDETRVQVYFDVLLREDPKQDTPSSVREIWHFLRETPDGAWKLDGIQQVA